MNWLIVLGSLVVAIIVSIGIGYFLVSLIVGQEVAQRNLRSVSPILILVGVITAFLGYYFSNTRYFLLALSVLSIISSIGYLFVWFWRKRQTGSLLLNVGLTRSNWLVLLVGTIFILFAARYTYTFMNQTTGAFSKDNNIVLFQLVIYWILAIFLVINGLFKCELRDKAICFMTAVIKWDEIESYKWEGKQGNILTIWLKKKFFGFPNHRTLPIPASKKTAAENILTHHLSGK